MSDPRTLLIVDDHAAMRGLIASVCSRDGDHVIELNDGIEALTTYALHQPDWVLMDVSMPLMDGLTATRSIVAAHPGARIVIVSQRTDPYWQAEAKASGAFAVMPKDDLSLLPELINGSAATVAATHAAQSES
jgi:CheY-like chemotaxis protein